MKLGAIPILALLILSTLLVVTPMLKDAHAVGPALNSGPVLGDCTAVAKCNTASLGTLSAGLLIIVSVEAYTCTAGLSLTISVNDTQALTWTSTSAASNAGFCGATKPSYDETFYAAAVSNTNDVISAKLSGCTGAQCNQIDVQATSWSGATGYGIVNTAVGSGSGTNLATSSQTFGANSILIGAGSAAAGSIAHGASYNNAGVNGLQISEYSTTVGSPTTFPFTGASGQWSDQGVVFNVLTSTLPIHCTIPGPGTHSSTTFAVSGGSPAPSPSTITCSTAGTTTNVAVQASTTITVTVPSDNASTRLRFSDRGTAVTTWSIVSCASGTCSTASNSSYYQLKNNFKMKPCQYGSPGAVACASQTWDAAYSENLVGTFLGTSSTTISTFSLANGGGAVTLSNIWADYDLSVGPPVNFAATGGSGGIWTVNATGFVLTTGGNTKTAGYWLQDQIIFQINAKALSKFTNAMSLQITGMSLGVKNANICAITTTVAATDSCTGGIDSGGNATFAQFLSSAPANTQWQISEGAAHTISNIIAAQTLNEYYYAQYSQLVKYSIGCISGCAGLSPTLSYSSLGAAATSGVTTGGASIYIDAKSIATISPTSFTDAGGNSYSVAPTSQNSSAALVFVTFVYAGSSVVTSTQTIVGWNVPGPTQMNYALLPMVLPLIVAALFASLGLYMKSKGDFTVTLLLFGLAVGSTFGMLLPGNSPGASTANISLVEAVICWMTVGLWIWQGSQGNEAGGAPR